MKSRLVVALAAALGVAGVSSAPASAAQDPEFYRSLLSTMKKIANEKGNVSRADQGVSYFKWLNDAPQGWDKAYFQLIELSKGTKYLSLKMTRKTKEGIEMLIISDPHLNGTPDDAYRGVGKTMAEADRQINIDPNKSKVALTPAMSEEYNAAIEQLAWEMGVKKN